MFLLRNKFVDLVFDSVSDLKRERDLIFLVVLFVLCSFGLVVKNIFFVIEGVFRISK